MPQDSHRPLWLEALHYAALWSIGVSQPVFEILGENPEFFVAHHAGAFDVVAFVLFVGLAGPLTAIGLTWCASRMGARGRDVGTWCVMTVLLALIALPIVRRSWPSSAGMTFALATSGGVLLALAYARASAVRLFVTFLVPAVVVVPAFFLFQPGVRSLLRAPEHGALQGVEFARTPPVVMVVFDQLPLVSLLAKDHRIDDALYPNFAELSRDAFWFRNATAVAGLTELALPAILTGARPVVGRLPLVQDHPGNLFTLLGSRYRMEATEPIAKLCPDTLCQRARQSSLRWLWSVLPDVSVVYLHVVLPADLTARLPPVTQNWKDFVTNDTAQGRWVESRRSDRSQSVSDFVASLEPQSDPDAPPLYFLHSLLPHEPWVHLPSGQQYSFGSQMVGLDRDGRWVTDEMAVLRTYQRHLLQVRFVDALLGEILNRLREVGLYDDAVVVVTSDHGASFQPGQPFRRARLSTFSEIGSVPLFIKTPGQRSGRTVDVNVEAIDVLPTLAGLLGVHVPWEVDGMDVLAPDGVFRTDKVFTYGDTGSLSVPAARVPSLVDQAVGQKFARFESADGFEAADVGLHDDLVGRRVDDFEVRPTSQLEMILDFPELFADVDHDAPYVPAHITGAVGEDDDLAAETPPPVLAVALNGRIAGVTRPYAFPILGRRHAWDLVADPRLLVSGANAVDVYRVLPEDDGHVLLERAYGSADATPNLNLILDHAGPVLGVTASGFFGLEWRGTQPFRWTSDLATLGVPVDSEAPPGELLVEILMTGPMKKSLAIMVNDCVLFEEEIFGAWRRAFPLLGCQLGRDTMQIQLRSDVSLASGTDRRELGVAVGRIELR